MSIRFSGTSIFYPHFIVPLAGLCLLLAGALTGIKVGHAACIPGEALSASKASNAASVQSDLGQKPILAYEKTEFLNIREGYLELSWSEIPEAASYSVSDAGGSVFYKGAFPKAFISGLSSGEYQFRVVALDSSGQIIARGSAAANVSVKHWPLYQAWISFAVGLIVFVAIVFVIVRGAEVARRDGLQSSLQVDSLASTGRKVDRSGAVGCSEGEV